MKDISVDSALASEYMQKEVERIGINLDTLLMSTVQERTNLFFQLQEEMDPEEANLIRRDIQTLDEIILDLRNSIYGR